LRAANEVRAPQFTSADGVIDAETLAIARAIIAQRTGKFDPSRFRDRYQEALQELIEARMKGVAITPRSVTTPTPVIDLMAALKRSLAQEGPAATASEGLASACIGRPKKEGWSGDRTSDARGEARQDRLTPAIGKSPRTEFGQASFSALAQEASRSRTGRPHA
jgi:hypothetical protein